MSFNIHIVSILLGTVCVLTAFAFENVTVCTQKVQFFDYEGQTIYITRYFIVTIRMII